MSITRFYNANSTIYLGSLQYIWHLANIFLSRSKVIILAYNQKQSYIIGVGTIDIISRPRGGRIGYLGEIMVDTKQRRKGIASMIINQLIEEAKSKKCHRVILHCEKSLTDLYIQQGFHLWDMGLYMDL